MKNVQEPVATLRVTRLIKAPRERVFVAWTTPEDIYKWFGPATCTVLSAKVDLRVGGEYRFRVNSSGCADSSGASAPTDRIMEVSGIYREIRRPSRLVYTWAWGPREEFGESVVTVDFLDKEGFTEIQLTHDKLPSDESRQRHSHGWNGCFDKLEALTAVRS